MSSYICLYTVKARKLERRFFEVLANAKFVRDTLNSENWTYSRSVLITLYNDICFGGIKERLLLRAQNVCLIDQFLFFEGIDFYEYLLIIRTTDNSK